VIAPDPALSDALQSDPSASGVVVLGAGRQALETCGYLAELGIRVVALVEEHEPPYRRDPGDFSAPIVTFATMPDAPAGLAMLTAVGEPLVRRAFVARVPGAAFTTVVARAAWVSRAAEVGVGVTIAPLAAVNAGSVVGDHVLVNTGAIVSHTVRLGDHVTVGPGARIGGETTIGEDTTIGIGATVIDHIRIGAGVIVAAGAVVVRNVADGTTVMGVPARPVDRAQA
jgi:sugar O-acyltransferase (sialic acid O-acetyltransferase NeuD family)